MKLKKKLVLSFCIMIIMPILLCGIVLLGIFNIQAKGIYHINTEDGNNVLFALFSPVAYLENYTDDIYEELYETVQINPQQVENKGYLEEVDQKLKERMSCLVVRKNGMILYSSSELDHNDINNLLPGFNNAFEQQKNVATYQGGDYRTLIKQIDFYDNAGNEYSISILLKMEKIRDMIKVLFIEITVCLIAILVITSLVLDIWIYRSVVIPLDKLRIATRNIKEGNYDFDMNISEQNEIGDVCRDFEEMRIILKQTAEDKLKSDVEEKELIRNISHDLKTPLTAVKGYVEGILDGIANTPEKQQKYLMTIANKVSDMDRLIDELTIFSKLDTNRVPYSFAKINVKGYFDDCCEEIRLDLDAQDIELEYNCYVEDDICITADTEQLKRVINNIISNSVKYRSESRKGKIAVNIYDEGEYVHISISDNGKGIASKDVSRIFERFYRTDKSRNSKQGGSGIGLAIVKKIIEDHKGKIWAESTEGKGTTMHINLLKYKE